MMASGKLQALCYKYEIEKTLRTPDYAGFQLLALNDYSYPVNTLAQDETEYDQSGAQPPSGHCNWNGTTWIPFNYMVFHGLLNYGYNDVAKELAHKTFDLVYKQNALTREYYNSDTGEGYGRNPFYGWSTLAYFMPLEYELGYDPTKIKETKMLPLATMILESNMKNKTNEPT